MHLFANFAPLALTAAVVLAAPAEKEVEKRQDFSDLLNLASEAAIPLPTNQAQLLSLYPLATGLLHFLPTEPVLSVLETAAPSGFLSRIVHDPGYAASFEQEFAAGSSPSWFLGLPTDVKEYLHTYQGYGGLASAVIVVESGAAAISSAAASASASAASAGQSITQTTITATVGQNSTASTASAASTGSTASTASTASVASVSSTSTAQGGAIAPQATAAVAASMAGVLAVLGAVVLL